MLTTCTGARSVPGVSGLGAGDSHHPYSLTDGKLVSPAGFSVDEPVWIKNEVWIETDHVPRYCNLNVYDMHHVVKRNKEWLS